MTKHSKLVGWGSSVGLLLVPMLLGAQECNPDSWPSSANEALYRSSYWKPATQTRRTGTLTTSKSGQVIENLRIVDGNLVIKHSNVKVRNVTVECENDRHAGNFCINIDASVSGIEIDGVKIGPPKQFWYAGCGGRAYFAAAGIRSNGSSSWTLRNSAIYHVGDPIKSTKGDSTGTFSDLFIELAVGWAGDIYGPCDDDHPDVTQIQNDSVKLGFTRIWMDALPYHASSATGPITQLSTPPGSTCFQIESGASADLTYNTVRFHSGNYNLRLLRRSTVRMTNSLALGAKSAPILEGTEPVSYPVWSGNRLGDGRVWNHP